MTARHIAADEWGAVALDVLGRILIVWTLYAFWPVLTTAGGHHGSNLVRMMRLWT